MAGLYYFVSFCEMGEADRQLQAGWDKLVQQRKVAVSQRMWFPGGASESPPQHEVVSRVCHGPEAHKVAKAVEAGCQGPRACEVAKAVEAGSRRASWRRRWKPVVGVRGGEGGGTR